MHLHEATIHFHGSFPLDMLRFDSCWPKQETDAAIIESSFRRGADNMSVRVLCRKEHKSPELAWTDGRWESFGAKVSKKRLL